MTLASASLVFVPTLHIGVFPRWFAFTMVLAVAWGLRDSRIMGGPLAGALLEAGVLLTEVSSVLFHLGEITGAPFLRFYATKFRKQAGGAAGEKS